MEWIRVCKVWLMRQSEWMLEEFTSGLNTGAEMFTPLVDDGVTCPVFRGTVLLKNEEFARNLTNGRQQLLRKQDVTIVSTVNLDSRINKYLLRDTQLWYTDWHHHWRLIVYNENIQQGMLLRRRCSCVKSVVLWIVWHGHCENFLVSEPHYVNIAFWILDIIFFSFQNVSSVLYFRIYAIFETLQFHKVVQQRL